MAEQVAKTLGISTDQLDLQQPLSEMGLDSLMAIELKNAVEAELGVELSLDSFSAELTVATLAGNVGSLLSQSAEGDRTAANPLECSAAAEPPVAATAAPQPAAMHAIEDDSDRAAEADGDAAAAELPAAYYRHQPVSRMRGARAAARRSSPSWESRTPSSVCTKASPTTAR